MTPYLSRTALRRVAQSLLTGELDVLRRRHSGSGPTGALIDVLPDELSVGEALGCDSLEVLQLSAAVNEMFHLSEAGLHTRLMTTKTFGAWLSAIEEAWGHGVDRITLKTSGSTGVPKRCIHSFRHLITEVDYLASVFHDRTRICALAPARHIYGLLFTALLPDRLGIPLVDLGSITSEARQKSPCFLSGDLIVSVPSIWNWLDRSISHWETGISGVTSTAPCPESTLASLSDNGLSTLVEVYGATETAGIGTRKWPESSFTLMPHWTRNPSDINSAALFSIDSDVQILPMDELRFSDEKHFTIVGRTDGAVQVGGTNVFLSQIEARLADHPGILAAAVRLMRQEEGERLKCFLVPNVESDLEHVRQSIETFVATWPNAVERPKLFVFGPRLPKNAGGKLCDW